MKLSEKLTGLLVEPFQWRIMDDLIEECRQLETMTQWQPIDENTPQNTELFLKVEVNGKDRLKPRYGAGCFSNGVLFDWYHGAKPTHWMYPPQAD